ncbi:xanthine dehydrogenase/oxidase-like [Porites lutea]|uniref:xanthine dehydrogenase/oxidase-like n=1 Tax=Porites lutea TaxID=51062 RepID=UPI003CC69A65
MCREGGCGCCVVSVTRNDLSTGKDATIAVNSCLFPLCASNGAVITTVEGIGNRFDGYHPIQERLADHNGSQCGYCSPGFVMSMYSLLKENRPSKQEIEASFDGNMCRCTGYRPILDAMKTFAKSSDPIDIEEISKCSSPCFNGEVNCSRKCVTLSGDREANVLWYCPKSKADLYALMCKHKNDKVRLVAGNTGQGIYKNDGPFDVMIDINMIEELHNVPSNTKEQCGSIKIGAGVSLNTFISVLNNIASTWEGFNVMADHIRKVANVPVRNVGGIAGNLMLTHAHSGFPSDIFTILEAVEACLIIGDSTTESESQYSLLEFLSLDMTGKVILAVMLPVLSRDYIIFTHKVMPRSQNAHAYVNAGFVAKLDKNTMTLNNVRIVYAGITPFSMHAVKTEAFLTDKNLTKENTLTGALEVLEQEISPHSFPTGSSKKYRKSLALGLFYKFFLSALGDKASARVRSAAMAFIRPVSCGVQSYDSKPQQYPLTKPLNKLTAKVQTSGEAQYVSDIPAVPGELHAAFVVSKRGNCKISSVDASEALILPGVVKYITAADIPKGGVNNFMPVSEFEPEEVLCTGNVLFAGQALGLIVADTQRHADEAAKAVKIVYKEQKPPILTIDEAIKANSFFDVNAVEYTSKAPDTALKKGDADAAIRNSPHIVQGTVYTGNQFQYHIENQIALCVPEDDSLTVHCATQKIDGTQRAVAKVLNLPIHRVNMGVKRCGGAFGARITRANQVAAACAIASYVTKRPVRLRMDLNTNMEMFGSKEPFKAVYKVGVSEDGKLNGIDLNYYGDCGCSSNDATILYARGWMDNAYFCPNWNIVPHAVRTNKPSNTWCRAPGSSQAVFIMESIMEHVAKTLNKTPEEVRELNLYKNGQVTQTGQKLKDCNISSLWNDLMLSSDFMKRKEAIDTFNKDNRWRKRGISVVPLKYGVRWDGRRHTALVSIYHTDGTVAIAHGGIDIGQGINTKVAQVAAHQLKCPLEMIVIKPTTAFTNPNNSSTAASSTSEMCCKAVMECCEVLNKVIDPIRKTMPSGAAWPGLIERCYDNGVHLSATSMYQDPTPPSDTYTYNTYGVTCTEVEVNVLTGERQILRTDILNDCGESKNPVLDIGQVEGAFMMGVGQWLTEKFIYDPQTGRNLSNGTWDYKPPCSQDIPIDFRVSLLKNVPNPLGIIRSKTSGEPAQCMACCCLFAVKHAVEEARAEVGKGEEYFVMNGPSTVEDTQLACLVDPSHFTL